MSVLVKEMNKPKTCGLCKFCLDDSRIANGYCMYFHRSVNMMELDKNCPLVEVPTPHGRLVEFIDVIATVNEDDGTEEVCFGDVFKAYYEMKEAPTVIEAEEEHGQH